MSRFLFSLLLLLAAGLLPAQETLQQPSRADLGLMGKVQSVQSVCSYTSGADMNFEEQWNYDQNGALLTYVKRGFGGERVTTYPLRQASDPRVQTDVDYDGDPLERRTYTSDHRLRSSQHFIYGREGLLAVVIEYGYDLDKQGAVTSRKMSQYDQNGNLTSVLLYDVEDVLLLRERYRYNRHGDVVRRTQESFADGECTTTTESRDYEYDRQGNWTECRLLYNGNLISTTNRTITYYD